MSAYKQFNSQDIIISPLELTKGFTYLGGGTLATASISISSSAQYTSSNYYSIERYLGNKFCPTGSAGFNFKISSSEPPTQFNNYTIQIIYQVVMVMFKL